MVVGIPGNILGGFSRHISSKMCIGHRDLRVHSLKLTVRHGKSTILMVFTRKDGDFHGRAVSFREGSSKSLTPYGSGF